MQVTRKAGRPKKEKAPANTQKLSTKRKLKKLAKVLCAALTFSPLSDLDVWADKYRILPRETSSEYGQWRTQRFPFLRRPMKCMSPSSIAREIVCMKGAQLGFTELGITWILYSAACDPGPMGYVQKIKEDIEDFSKQKLKPSIDACPAVYYTLGEGRPRGYTNKYNNKSYPGGFVLLGPATSTGFLKSKSWGRAFMDEEDEYPLNVNNQGSPRLILKKRMVNFPGSKLVRVSTPVLDELSTIKDGFNLGSQEQYYVPCPYCNPKGIDTQYMFLIEWETIKWGKEIDDQTGDPVDVWCECPQCGGRIDEEKYKTWMLDHGDWFSTKNPKDPDKPLPRYRVGDVPNPSFRIPSFYSPWGFYSWHDAVHEFHEYLRTRDRNLLQVFINQTCARTFSLEGGEVDHTGLYKRREVYASKHEDFEVPEGGLCLTAGVDVQDDRIEVEVVAWGELEENWSVDYKVIPGDTQKMGDNHLMLPNGQPSVWRLLDEYLFKRFNHSSGNDMAIEFTMIDCGHRTQEVHLFCRPREARRIYPCRGKFGFGSGYVKRIKRRHEEYKTWDYIVYVDELKTKTYDMLKISEVGPGYCHFPIADAYDTKHFVQLTSERRKVRTVRGQKQLFWEQHGRNEALDTRNYATAAFLSYPVNLKLRKVNGLPQQYYQMRKARVRRRVVHAGLRPEWQP